MRIAYVSAHYAPMVGGVEKHVAELAGCVARLGHRVEVLTHAEADTATTEERDGVTVRRFGVPMASTNYAFSPALMKELVRVRDSFDVIHAHGYHALPALQAALSNPRTLVFTPHYHGTGHSRFRKLLHPPYRRLGAMIFHRAGRTIAVSPPEARLILSHFPAIESRLVVIGNGVHVDSVRDAQPLAESRRIVFSAGRLESYKQVDKTIDAMAHLPADYVLRITGDGAAREGLEARAAALGLDDRIAFLGKVSEQELYRWFRSCSVYVSMSSNEAMPVAFIESLAAGARVLASDIPAHRDLVKKTEGSIVLTALDTDPSALAERIEALAAQPAAPARIETWDDVAERTLEVYEEAIGERLLSAA
ncbi:MAG TPA: glycosyltransferase family 4 protein [Solirubrobacteraceae bacterium]|jgi:glycosyltransferase involved in cell wall biosynthesis